MTTRRRVPDLLALAVPTVAGVVVLLAVTRRGAYLSPDALAYVGTARNLVDGPGYVSPLGSPPIENFAPLYALLLAGVGALGPDPLTAARFVNPLAFGLTILLAGLLVRRMTGSVALAIAAQVLVLAGVDFLTYHSAALSEPLFLLLVLLAVALLVPCLSERRPGLLLAAAAAAGAASLTRYAGVAVVAGGAASLLLLGNGRRRWMRAAAFSAIALAPLFGWLAWVSAERGRTTNRTAVLHAPDVSYLTDGLRSASTWFLPDTFPWPVRVAVAAVLVAGVVTVAWRDSRRTDDGRGGLHAALLGLFSLAYLAALVIDRFLFDVTGRLDARFLLVLHAAAIATGLWALRSVDLSRSHLVRFGLSAVVGLQVAAGAVWVADATGDADIRPGGFASPSWTESELLDQVRALPENQRVYTNQVDALYFHTGRGAVAVPEKRTFLTGKPNASYEAELAAMDQDLRAGGLLVYFTKAPARQVFLPRPEELEAGLMLQAVLRDPIGVAYRPRR